MLAGKNTNLCYLVGCEQLFALRLGVSDGISPHLFPDRWTVEMQERHTALCKIVLFDRHNA